MNISQLKDMIRTLFLSRAQRPYLIALLLALVFGLYWDLSQTTKTEPSAVLQTPETADTLIPAGFVLVPIEVQNFESLDSILGQYGIVDLYQAPLKSGGRPYRVASHIKILRAPLNPSHFAVLVNEADSVALIASQHPFTVVVQRALKPGEKTGTTIEDPENAADALRRKNVRMNASARKLLSRITVEVTNAQEDNHSSQN